VNSQEKKIHWVSLVRLLLAAGVIVYVFSRFIPCVAMSDYVMVDGIDISWTQALHRAFAAHWQFGTDLVFTYGPWGFLGRGYYPPTYRVAVATWTFFSLVFLCAGWRLARHFSENRLAAGLWLVSFTAAASLPVAEDVNDRLIAVGVLFLFLHFFVEKGAVTPMQILLAGLLGWLSLIKFTGLVESLVLVAVIAGDNLFRHRRFPWIVPVWLASFLCFWIAAGQHWISLKPFLVNSWRITSGYTEAMMLPSPVETRNLVIFLLLSGFLCGLTGWLAWRRHRYFSGLPVAGLGIIFFMIFKLGYVRAGWQHETTSAMVLVLVSLAALAVARPGAKPLFAAAATLLAASTLFTACVFNYWLPGNGLGRQLARTFSLTSLFAPVAVPYTGYLRNDFEKNLAAGRQESPLPSVAGRVDLYSFNQNVLFAHALTYQPRPVIQSYSAFTPELAEMNAAHLRTGAAAGNIFFAVQTMDNHFPALDDGLSWLELLTRYDLRGATDDKVTYLLLSRAPVPRQFHLTPLRDVAARFGEPVSLPPATNAPIWVEIAFQKTLAGTLASTFFKPPELTLTVSLADHSQHCYRLIPGMTRTGFLLSPLILDTSCFAALATSGLQNLTELQVTSLTLAARTESGSTTCYQTPVPVRFYRLDYPLQNVPMQRPLPAAKD
jgi:hypothetical protein